jgi:predicted nucleic acid-binding protein
MIVFDASTLILLAKSDLLESFLKHSGNEAAMPKEVERESCAVKSSPDALMIERAISENKIKVKSVKNKGLRDKLRSDFGLGRGEAEAIALALSESAELVAIDDRNGINACKLLRIGFTTALGILVRMREKGLIGKDEALLRLRALERYGRYKAEIVADARRKLEGS